jgi:hypothetical protein
MRPMLMTAAAMLLFTVLSGMAADPAPAPAVKLDVQGIRIVKPAPGGNDKMRAFNWTPGTTLALLISLPQGGLISIDRDASKVASVTDDKGKDLTKAEQKDNFGRDEVSFEMSPEISPDGKLCSTELEIPGTPGKGASSITVAGTLVLQVGTQKKDFSSAVVTLQPDAKINAGAIPLTVTKIGKPGWGDDDYKYAITLSAKQALDDIVDIQFFDAGGKKIESKRGPTQSMKMMNAVTVDWEFQFKNKVDAAKVVVTYWMDRKAVSVPIKLSTGIGF